MTMTKGDATVTDLAALRYLTAYIKTQSLSDAEAEMVAATWSIALDVVEAVDEVADLQPTGASMFYLRDEEIGKIRDALARFKEATDDQA